MTTPTTVLVQLKVRSDTAANWTSANPTLLANELGRETDTGRIKIGTGSTAWTALPYQPFGALITNADISATAEIAVSKLADGAARQLLQTDAASTGVEWTSNVDIPGTLDVTGAATFDAAVTVAGDLTVNGTTTTISTQNLLVEDKNIIIGDVASPTDVTADGGGITLKGATDKTINWVDATDAWTSSERFSVPLGTAALPSLTFTGDPNTGIYSPGADQVAISTGGSGRLFVDASGRVGIGEAASVNGLLRLNAASGANSNLIFSENNTDRYLLGQVTGDNAFRVYDLVANTERLRITSAGLVGVGTSSPATALDVNGTITARGSLIFKDANNSNTYGLRALSGIIVADTGTNYPTGWNFQYGNTASSALYIDSSGRVGVGTTSPAANLHIQATTGASLRIQAGSTNAAQIDLIPGGTSNPYYVYVDSSRNFIFQDNASERLRIDSSGRLGIGTSSPAANSLLTLGGSYPSSSSTTYVHAANGTIPSSSTVEAAAFLSNYSTQDAAVTYSSLAHYIAAQGTITGGSRLGVTTQIGFQANASLTGATNNYGFFSNIAAGSGRWNFYAAGTANNYFAGSVGIGTTSPSALLHVSAANANIRIGVDASSQYTDIFRDNATGVTVYNAAQAGAFRGHVWQLGGTEAARIDSSGRLLVGTSTSTALSDGEEPFVQVKGTDSRGGLSLARFSNDNQSCGLYIGKSRGASIGSNTIVTSGDELGRITFSGSDGTDLNTQAASIKAEVDGTPGANDMPGRLVFSTTADGASSPTERMRIQSNGTVFITQSNSGTYGEYINFSNGGYGLGISNASGGVADLVFFFSPNYVGGITTNGSATSYLSASDYRLKENITLVADSITRLRQLKPIRFNFIADPSKTVDGFLAHEVQAVVPEAVTGERDAVDDEGNPQYQGIDQSKLVPLLTAALQEAIGEIESLKARVAALESA